jgi:hypothetical protein
MDRKNKGSPTRTGRKGDNNMKKGTRIPISAKARYTGQDMKWTETYTGDIKLFPGGIVYHCSSSLLKSFYPKETCFLLNNPPADEFIYALVVKNAISVPSYSNEVRIDLEKHRDDAEIFYIGSGGYERIRDEFGRVIKYKKILDIMDVSNLIKN